MMNNCNEIKKKTKGKWNEDKIMETRPERATESVGGVAKLPLMLLHLCLLSLLP